MTKEQIKEKAKDFVSKIAGGTSKEMDYYANILAEFATEVTKELKEENAELRKEWQEQVQKATDEGYARTLQTIQLTKAKEIIKDLLGSENTSCEEEMFFEIRQKAEQFLKEEPQSKWVNPARTTNDNQIKLSEVKND